MTKEIIRNLRTLSFMNINANLPNSNFSTLNFLLKFVTYYFISYLKMNVIHHIDIKYMILIDVKELIILDINFTFKKFFKLGIPGNFLNVIKGNDKNLFPVSYLMVTN